tara:strand:- start:41 stop:325 length:285 start_codon:yes stop_codon:yes gene_type:complete
MDYSRSGVNELNFTVGKQYQSEYTNTYIDIDLRCLFSSATENYYEFIDLGCSHPVKLSEHSIPISVTFSVGKYIGVGLSISYTLSRVDSLLVSN